MIYPSFGDLQSVEDAALSSSAEHLCSATVVYIVWIYYAHLITSRVLDSNLFATGSNRELYVILAYKVLFREGAARVTMR